MKRVSVLNTSKVMKSVKGTDGKVYYLPPRKAHYLPANVEISEGMCKELKITVSSS